MAKREVRIGQTDEDRDWAAEELASLGFGPKTGSYMVDVGVEKPFNVIVTKVPLKRTAELYAEAKRRSPSFRCSLLYDGIYPFDKDDSPRITFKDFIAGKKA